MDIEGTLAILFIFGTPFLLAIVGGGIWIFTSTRKQAERERARQSYERLTRDKLDVIKTAIAMGRSDDEIRELDQRLERLVGSEKLHSLLDPKAPTPPPVTSEILDADIVDEVDRQQGRVRE